MRDISVVLPVYNAGAPLGQAIRSILRQTREDFELLIIDDCSKDQSRDIIQALEKQDSRIRAVYHKTNQGLSRTLNEALHVASGKYVVRMDQDDESLPERLEKLIAYLDARPQVVVVGSYIYHMGQRPEFDRLVTLPVTHEEISAALPKYNCMYHPSVAMRREPILSLGGYRGDFKNAEDYDLWLRVSRVHKLANFPEPLLRYRFSTSGMTLNKKWEQLFFVHLAQESHKRPDAELASLVDEARAKLDSENRLALLECVYDSTIRELAALRCWRDALSMARKSIPELGWMSAAVKFLRIVKSWALSRRAAA